MIGDGLAALMERALEGDISARVRHEALERLTSYYLESCTETTSVYPDIKDMLARVAQRYPLALVTNKNEAITRIIIGRLAIDHFFEVVVGGDTLPFRKPNAGVLNHVAAILGVRATELLVVGDSSVDQEMALRAGARFAGVSWGYYPGPLSAVIVADDAAGLAKAILAL